MGNKKEINITEMLCENEGVLQAKDGVANAKILDIELDPIECSFNNDDCVQINTEGYSYITLSTENLEDLLRLIYEAKAYYDEYFENEED